jgi:hypothetical protein
VKTQILKALKMSNTFVLTLLLVAGSLTTTAAAQVSSA